MKTTTKIQYVIEASTDSIYEISGQRQSQSMRIANGNYKLVFFVDSEYAEEFEMELNDMEEVISYKEV